ncbi:MAG: hypothetical protein KF713_05495 [Turneriella sp.]|nr:hypothetical protein [Turneriella sp.]
MKRILVLELLISLVIAVSFIGVGAISGHGKPGPKAHHGRRGHGGGHMNRHHGGEHGRHRAAHAPQQQRPAQHAPTTTPAASAPGPLQPTIGTVQPPRDGNVPATAGQTTPPGNSPAVQ